MKRIAGWVAAAVLVAGTGIGFADDPPKGPEHPQGEGKKTERPPENVNENAGLDAWMKHGKLTEEHKILARFAGRWETISRMAMMPGQPEREMKGSSESTLILGGRFVETKAKGEFGGRPLESFGLFGYDTMQKKFTSESADSMGTWVVHALGDYDAATSTITFHGEYSDPMSDGRIKMKFRWTFKFVSDDEFVFEMYEVPPPKMGPEYKAITVTYKRIQGK